MLKHTALTSPEAAARATRSAVSSPVRASGFSQTTCLPASRHSAHLFGMEMVGAGDMDNVDVGIGNQRLEALVDPREIGRGGLGSCPLRRGPDHPGHLHPETTQRLDVGEPMKPTPTTPVLISLRSIFLPLLLGRGHPGVQPRQSDDDRSVQHPLDRLARSQERQQRLEHAQDQRPQDGAGVGAHPAKDRCSTDYRGGHRRQHEGTGQLQIDGTDPTTQEDPGDGPEEAGDGIGGDQHLPGTNTGEARGRRVVTKGVEVAPEPRFSEHEDDKDG